MERIAALSDAPPAAHVQQILDNAEAAIFVKDLDGRYLFVNREFERIKGLPGTAIIGRSDVELFPDEAPRFRGNDAAVLKARRAVDFEDAVQTERGVRTYLSHRFPLLDARGAPYALGGIATDITERRRSEEALRAAALAISSTEGDAVFIELCRYLTELLGTDVAMIAVPTDDDPAIMRTLAVWLDGRALRNFDFPLEASPCRHVVGRAFRFVGTGINPEFPPGTLFAASGMDSYAAFPLVDAGGRALGIVAAMARTAMHDAARAEAMLKIFAVRAVAEIAHMRSAAALRTCEASYRAIFEASEDAIFVHDFDTGAFVDANPRACLTYGYTVDEFRAMAPGEIGSGVEPYTTQGASRFLELARRGAPVSFEWHRRNRDGTLHWDEVRLKAATIAGTRRILAFTREITARKEAEDALRASAEQYRAIFNASADALVLWSSQFQRVDVNPAYERMYGYTRDEAIGGLRARELTDGHRQRQQTMIARTLAGEHCHEEIETVRRNGERFPIEVRTIPFRHRGEPHVLAMIRDLTERRHTEHEHARLEAQLRQAQKMEAIGHLTGGIAHDFNNLLTSIVGYIALASERCRGSDAKLDSYLERAALSCGRARDLIQQMLTFSRGGRGEPRLLALAPLLRDSMKLLRSSLPSTVELHAELDEDAPPVLLDPVQLEQVLMNLAINARDAMRATGRIVVALRRVEAACVCASCRANVEGDYVELAVADAGPGIGADVQERMFEPFFSTKPVGQGSGMGLATVHGIVHEHGGHIAVESVLGAGTTFRILLPALATQDARSPWRREEPGPGGGSRRLAGRVAVVDDEIAVVRFMEDWLAHWGLAVATFASAHEALDALVASDDFDLVITDQTMPAMTGLEFARAARAIRPELPIVMYTGFADCMRDADIARAGISALVRKPIDASELYAVLSAHLHRVAA